MDGTATTTSVLAGITMTAVVGTTTVVGMTVAPAGTTAEVAARPDKNTPADGRGVLYFASTPSAR
jgi:hypothetical protein